MGSCISKCKRKMNKRIHVIDGHCNTQDKLVISRTPLTTVVPHHHHPRTLSDKISPYPPSPSSTSSVSSLTCVSTNTINSSVSSMSMSTATSAFNSTEKDKLFSDDFLWSCYKANPHVVRINSLKAANNFRPNSPPASKLVPAVVMTRQPTPQWVSRPQKRVRSNSPTRSATNLTRPKSFKKDQNQPPPPLSLSNLSSRTMKSSSPSRRFSGEKYSRSDSKRMVSSASLIPRNRSAYNSNQAPSRACSLMKKETCIHRIRSKIDENDVGDTISNQDDDSIVPMEDMDNPLISLDCFIFL